MKNIAKSAITARFSPRACLCAIGARLRALDLLAPVKEKLRINQKTVQHTPLEKLEDALIAILAGAHGLAEINTRLRSDLALQRAFGRRACADQSVVQATLECLHLDQRRPADRGARRYLPTAEPGSAPRFHLRPARPRCRHHGHAVRQEGRGLS
jgi:hypothetical protein